MAEKRNVLETILAILLMVVTVFLFSTWGYQSVQYILSRMFDVQNNTTIYDLLIGVIAIVSSIFVFTGATLIWKMKSSVSKWITMGAIGFLLKNVLDIINDVIPLFRANQVTTFDISSASWQIAADVFQFAFWIFIIIYFNRDSFRNKLS